MRRIPGRAAPHIGVIGAGECDAELSKLAQAVGRGIAEAGGVLVCGGLGGVMEAACRGAKSAGGMTIGILPGADRSAANEWVDVAIATGVAEARNLAVINTADALIAVGGSYGTLSEIGFALKAGKKVVGLRTWDIKAIIPAATAEEAVQLALD